MKNKSVIGNMEMKFWKAERVREEKQTFNTQFIPLVMLMSASRCILVLTRRAGVKFVGYTNITGKPLKY